MEAEIGLETELKLPYAEHYSFKSPQKIFGKEKLDRYVKEELGKVHPGFNEDSLWDYRLVNAGNVKVVEAFVMDKDFYIEKRLADENISFVFCTEEGRKLSFFEKKKFNERGDVKKGKLLLLIILAASAVALIFVFALLSFAGNKNKETVIEIRDEIEVTEDALNIFDLLNTCASVIEAQGGKIRSVSFSAVSGGIYKFSVTGCEPFSLITSIEESERNAECSCSNVIYTDGKENFELEIKIPVSRIIQKIRGENELLGKQNRIVQKLSTEKVTLVSAGCDKGSGRMSFVMECERKSLKRINEKLNQICENENLFTVSFEESVSDTEDLFFIRIELIELDENQGVKSTSVTEKLSEVFERTVNKKQSYSIRLDEENKTEKETLEKARGWKKIGSVNKAGRILYYYRTPDGKIETSEEIYE